MHKIVFFASGSGTNFQSVIDAIDSGELDAEITGLLTNNPKAGAIKRAENHSIPVRVINRENTTDYTKDLLNALADFSPDLVVLAGYMKKIPDEVIDRYSGKIINIHPSLLPKYGGKGFYGIHVHRAVIESGERLSGCTVHYVDEIYDNGSIIARQTVSVEPDDTPDSLAHKILKEEHKLLPGTIKKLLTKTS